MALGCQESLSPGKTWWNKDMLLLLLLSHFSRVQLCATPPGSPVPGILQARTLEWVAISFSNAWKWNVKVKSLSCVWLLATPWTAAYQASPSVGFFKQEYWSRVPLPSPTYLSRQKKITDFEDRSVIWDWESERQMKRNRTQRPKRQH